MRNLKIKWKIINKILQLSIFKIKMIIKTLTINIIIYKNQMDFAFQMIKIKNILLEKLNLKITKII